MGQLVSSSKNDRDWWDIIDDRGEPHFRCRIRLGYPSFLATVINCCKRWLSSPNTRRAKSAS